MHLKPRQYKIRLEYLKPIINKVLDEGIENNYYSFRLPKRGGKGFRVICAPSDNLKYIQREILKQFTEAEHLFRNNSATGFNPGTGIKLNALKQAGYYVGIGNYLLSIRNPINSVNLTHEFSDAELDPPGSRATVKMDLADAFGSIGAGMILREWPAALNNTIEEKELIVRLCTLNGTLPQGAPTSPMLLNIALRNFDRECKQRIFYLIADVSKATNIYFKTPYYTRYADDISISFNRSYIKPYWLINIVKKICNKYGLRLKDTKTRYMTARHGRFVTGINIVNQDHLSIPRKNRSKIRAAIHQAALELDPDKKAKLITSIKGRILHVYSIDITHGIQLYKYAIKNKLIDESITIAGKSFKDVEKIAELEIKRRTP